MRDGFGGSEAQRELDAETWRLHGHKERAVTGNFTIHLITLLIYCVCMCTLYTIIKHFMQYNVFKL